MVTSLAWSPDGTCLAAGGRGIQGGELLVWDVQRWQRIDTIAKQAGIVYALAWGASADVLISGGGDGTIGLWDVRRGICTWQRQAHQGAIQSLRRSPDGIQLASCADDGAIKLWDLDSGAHLRTLRRDRPYERLNIGEVRGLTDAQALALRSLGAIDAGAKQGSGADDGTAPAPVT